MTISKFLPLPILFAGTFSLISCGGTSGSANSAVPAGSGSSYRAYEAPGLVTGKRQSNVRRRLLKRAIRDRENRPETPEQVVSASSPASGSTDSPASTTTKKRRFSFFSSPPSAGSDQKTRVIKRGRSATGSRTPRFSRREE